MRSLHILFILVVVTWLGFPLRAQEAISIGTRHTLFSHVLNEVREYWVYVPATRPGDKPEGVGQDNFAVFENGCCGSSPMNFCLQ